MQFKAKGLCVNDGLRFALWYWPVKAQLQTEGKAANMSCSRQWQNLHGIRFGDGSEPPDGTSSSVSQRTHLFDPLWTPEQVAERLNVSPDWVRDHSSRKEPRLPVIRLGGGPGRAGLLRYRASEIEKFIEEMERLSRRGLRRI